MSLHCCEAFKIVLLPSHSLLTHSLFEGFVVIRVTDKREN